MRKFQFVICVEVIIYLLLNNLHDCILRNHVNNHHNLFEYWDILKEKQ